MATLVLGTVGRVFGGPLGGIVSTFVGGALDRGLFGGGATREGPRLANLAVQSAAYGEPLPLVYGRMRVAGNLVWTAGIKETRSRSGGGKSGPATNTYSYSSSFAVIVSARAIVGVERIWADGKLLRATDGRHNFPATVRVHCGDSGQAVDPLIAAAEGAAAPAYRGRALVVFEDLPLADYGNRIPNLTFEVVADAADVTLAAIAQDVAAVTEQGGAVTVGGFVAAQGGSVRQVLASLDDLDDLAVRDDGTTLTIGSGTLSYVAPQDCGASDHDRPAADRRETRAGESVVPDAVWLTYSDVDRDYQAGVQAATRRSPAIRVDRREAAVALAAVDAKRAAHRILHRAVAARTTLQLATSWRYAAVRPGDLVVLGKDVSPWRVTHRTITGAVVEFDLDRVASSGAAASIADGGRGYHPNDAPQGTTTLHVLDLPGLPGPLATLPRLLLAVTGGPSWRRADVMVSRDGGNGYTVAVTLTATAVTGIVIGALPSANAARWDRQSTIIVELSGDDDDLQGVPEAAVLAGANLALIGSEIIQFASVDALGARRFRLSTLLRGRRGTEHAVGGHGAQERFVLLDDRLAVFDPPLEAIGAPLQFKAVGPGDDLATLDARMLTPRGLALLPLTPSGLAMITTGGNVVASWRRRSRNGFAWSDGTDAPLAEDSERYRVTVRRGSDIVRSAIVDRPTWTWTDAAADRAAGGPLTLSVAQVSAVAGPGTETTIAVAGESA